jgi:CheY-like chemotaxis protein
MTDRVPSILYIDDDEGLRRLTRRALQRAGYRVELAANGIDGVAMAAAEPFDLVAVDHYMPGQDGLATLAALQALPVPPPVIYVTGSDESQIAVAALKAGAIDYVVKTVNDDYFDLLGQSIAQALATVSLRREKEQVEPTCARATHGCRCCCRRSTTGSPTAFSWSRRSSLQSRAIDDEPRARRSPTPSAGSRRSPRSTSVSTPRSVDSVDMAEYLDSLLDELRRPGRPRARRATSG